LREKREAKRLENLRGTIKVMDPGKIDISWHSN
jgi:hypothetical protein